MTSLIWVHLETLVLGLATDRSSQFAQCTPNRITWSRGLPGLGNLLGRCCTDVCWPACDPVAHGEPFGSMQHNKRVAQVAVTRPHEIQQFIFQRSGPYRIPKERGRDFEKKSSPPGTGGCDGGGMREGPDSSNMNVGTSGQHSGAVLPTQVDT